MPTSLSSRRTPGKTPSPPSSAHQRPQLSHHFQTSHGRQPPTTATSAPPPTKLLPTRKLELQELRLPPQLPNSSGPVSPPPRPSVDGAPSPPNSSSSETAGVSPSVPSVTPVTPRTSQCPTSGTTSGPALPRSLLTRQPAQPPSARTRTPLLLAQPPEQVHKHCRTPSI